MLTLSMFIYLYRNDIYLYQIIVVKIPLPLISCISMKMDMFRWYANVQYFYYVLSIENSLLKALVLISCDFECNITCSMYTCNDLLHISKRYWMGYYVPTISPLLLIPKTDHMLHIHMYSSIYCYIQTSCIKWGIMY